MTDTKLVKGYQLKVGDQVECYHTGNGFVSTGPVVASTKDGITLAWRDGSIAIQNLPYSYDFEVKLTREEFKAKYEGEAAIIIHALKNRVESYELGEHTLDNSWADIDAYLMAKHCLERKVRPYGVCYDITPKPTFCGDILDVGLCAVDEDGDEVWCHYKKEWLNDIFDNWELEHKKTEDKDMVLKFGNFVAQKRMERGISLRKMAEKVGLSAPYWSDIEKNRRNPPSLDKLKCIAYILGLSEDERNTMFDLAGDGRDTAGPDILAYIKENDYIATALRAARDFGASRDDWEKFVANLKREKDEVIT